MNGVSDVELDSWEKAIIHFFEHQVRESKLYKAREYLDNKSKEIKVEKDEKKLKKIKEAIDEKNQELIKLRDESPSSEIRDWIEKNSCKKIAKGKRIVKTTHSLKFTHSSAPNAGVLVSESNDDQLLTTASLNTSKIYDLAHHDGALITVSRFLAINFNGSWIYDFILKEDFNFLDGFAGSKEQLERWKTGFRNLVEERSIDTAELAKQVYYPFSSDEMVYHIIVPLFSSSIAEVIYKKISDTKFGEFQKAVRIQKKPKDGVSKYHNDVFVEYPDVSAMTFGGKNSQNISMLNKGRTWKAESKDKTTYGVSYFFNAAPPTWQSQLKPPVYIRSLYFESSIYWQAKEDIDYLRDFLTRFDRMELSIKDPKRMKWIEQWVGDIVDEVLFYIGSIQNLPAGWSAAPGIKLKPEHQYLLDPYRKDANFLAARANADWPSVVCKDFADWLNNKLTGKDKQFTPQAQHTRLWYQLFEPELRELIQTVEFDRKLNTEVEA